MAYDKMMQKIMERLDRIEALLQQQDSASKLPTGAVSATIETVETIVPGKPDAPIVPRRSHSK